MEKLPMCRICLSDNVRMYIVVNKNLLKLYEKLTENPFVTEDSRPMLACYFCCSKLKQCYQFQRQCLEAEELFAQMMNEGYEATPILNRDHPKICTGLSQTPTEYINIVGECQTESVAIKEELQVDSEGLDIMFLPKEQLEDHDNDELELENQDNRLSDVEDVPAQHSESDSEDDVPLMEYKIDVEEHEVSRNKRSASDTQRASVAEKPKLEDVMAEEEKNNEQSETQVIRKTENCTLTVTKLKEPTTDATRRHHHNFCVDTNSLNKKNEKSGKSYKVISSDVVNRLHSNELSHKCDICQHYFSKKNNLTRHIRMHTEDQPYNCDVCQQCFCNKSSLTSHMRTHTGEKPYKCDVCQQYFSVKGSVKVHMRTHTGKKPFKCDVCQHCFSYKSSLTKHIRTHTGEKPYKCDVCQSSFKQKGSLSSHIRTHSGVKPYKCEVCQQCFTLKSSLTKHIRIHTGEKPNKCDICQQCFSEKSTLTRHIRTHTGEKPYKCNICQSCFNRKSQLKTHIRTHSDEKPHKCDVCQQCFSDISNFKRHIRTHTGEKPHKCNVCQSSFNVKYNLRTHMLTHTGEKAYKCDVCEQGFSLKSRLINHIRTHTCEKPCRFFF